MDYKGYTLEVHPTWTEFGQRICFIKRGGLSITKTFGVTSRMAIAAAKLLVDWMVK